MDVAKQTMARHRSEIWLAIPYIRCENCQQPATGAIQICFPHSREMGLFGGERRGGLRA